MLIKEMNVLNVGSNIFLWKLTLISFGQRPWKFSILIKVFCLHEPKYVICNLGEGFTSVLKESFGPCKLAFKMLGGANAKCIWEIYHICSRHISLICQELISEVFNNISYFLLRYKRIGKN